MKVLVVHSAKVSECPPVLSLCRDLLRLGHSVTLILRGDTGLPAEILQDAEFELVDFGTRPEGPERLLFDLKCDILTRSFVEQRADEYDVVWTTTNLAARACGKALFGKKHVMQLMELAEYVPLFSRQDMPLHSQVVVELARRAFHVVVPEFNRAFIQQAWWRIPKTPVVLPNKSVVPPSEGAKDRYPEIRDAFEQEPRKIILYQGAFTPDRDFTACMDAIDLLGGDYALYLMGATEDDLVRLDALRRGRRGIELLPFVPAPDHLAFTDYGRIGLLPYQPSYDQYSPLNALYCAPNKIWEYSYFGLPMIGSCMPALKTTFDATSIGITVDFGDPQAIAEAVVSVDANWDVMSKKSRAYFDSVDTAAIVNRILNDPDASI